MSRALRPDDKSVQEILDKVTKEVTKNFGDIAQNKYTLTVDYQALKENAVVYIDPDAYEKMEALIDVCQKEVAWHCTVEKRDKGVYYITDVIMFPQTVTAATVTTDDTEYAMWIANLPDETFNNMRCHMHSHVNMGVSPSGVDRTYQNQVIQNEDKFFIFMIWNKKGDVWSTIVDVEDNILYEDADIDVIGPESDAYNWAASMVAQFVKENKPAKTIPAQYTWRDYQQEQVKRIQAEKNAAPSEEDDDDEDEFSYYTRAEREFLYGGYYE